MGAELADALLRHEELTGLFARIGPPAGSRDGAGTRPAAPADRVGSDVAELAARHGLRARPVRMRAAALRDQLRSACPILLGLGTAGYLLVVRVGGRRAWCLRADGRRVGVAVRPLLARLLAAEHGGSVDDGAASREHAGSGRERLSPRVRALLERERLRHDQTPGGWLLDGVAGAQPRDAQGLMDPRTLIHAAAVVACHLGQYLFFIASWLVLGRMVLSTGLDEGWLAVWALCLAASVVLNMSSRWLGGTLALGLGTRIKQRVLAALLSLSSDEARSAGLGGMIATTIDANRLDVLAINGGTATALAAVETVVLLVLVAALQAWPLAVLLLLFQGLLLVMSLRYYRSHQRWHATSLAVTALHTEEMIGHRARKTLLGMAQWYESEAQRLAQYNAASRAADALYLTLKVVPRVWILLGVATALLSTALLGGPDPVGLVAAIGVVLLGTAALKRAAQGLREAIDAAVSYRHLAEAIRLDAGAREAERPLVADPFAAAGDLAPALVADDLRFQYAQAAQPLLDGVSLHLRPGERTTLEGPSGGGKSTLARVLTGRLDPSHGSVTLGGLDVSVLGTDTWRRHVRYVPQYHNNHVLTESLLFNLLLGSGWPPTPPLMRRLDEVIDIVGLRPLVERMPAGLQQMVGEGGWRLSQGEQARLFLARGMLDPGRLLIVDEPFSALDPATSLEVLEALGSLDCMLMVITHR